MNHLKWITPALLMPINLIASLANAQVPSGQIQLGNPSAQGTGCPAGTVSASLSPDNQSLSILFGAFQAEAGGMSGKTFDRKSCQVSIPVQVPDGYSVSILKIDYRGYRKLPMQSSANFNVEYFFAGQQGPTYQKQFNGAEDGDFLLQNQLVATATVWSACGQDVNLRTNASISVQTNNFQEQAMITLDSADISAETALVYRLNWQYCGGGGGGGHPGGGGGHPGPGPGPNPYPVPPSPIPTPVPVPNPHSGACVIHQQVSHTPWGVQSSYVVTDAYGRRLTHTQMYAEALRIAQQGVYMGYCSTIIERTAHQPIPVPTPVPQPVPGPQYGSCKVMPGRDAYGRTFFRVVDRFGRMVADRVQSSAQAQQIARSDRRCFQ